MFTEQSSSNPSPVFETEWRVEVNIPWGKLGTVMDWCRVNCTSKWSLVPCWGSRIEVYKFIFVDEKDATAFTMKWM